MFVSTGNGYFDDTSNTVPPTSTNDFGESFLNLNPTTLAVQDFYTPSQSAAWTASDIDISSGGITVLPDGVGPAGHPNLVVGADKGGNLWLMDRSNMSRFNSGGEYTVQYVLLPGAGNYSIHSGPAYWNGTVYMGFAKSPLMAFKMANGLLPVTGTASPTTPQTAAPTSQSAETYY